MTKTVKSGHFRKPQRDFVKTGDLRKFYWMQICPKKSQHANNQ